jgi:hypothetical protein
MHVNAGEFAILPEDAVIVALGRATTTGRVPTPD